MLVAAVLGPEQREHRELEVVGLPAHELDDAVELTVRQTEGAVQRLFGDRAQGISLAPAPEGEPVGSDDAGSGVMSRRHLVMLLVLSAIWGASFLFIKVGVRDYEPSTLVFLRVLLAALTLAPIAAVLSALGGLTASWKELAVMGALNSAIPFWLLSFGETRIDSGLSAVLQAAAPIFTVLLAIRLDPSQRATGTRLLGVVVGFLGVALLVGAQSGGDVVAALAIVATAACYAAGALYGGRRLAHLPPIGMALGTMLAASILIAPAGLVQLPDSTPHWKATASVVVLGVVGTGLAYILYFGIIVGAGASRAILVTYLVPAMALLYGALFLDETITAVALGGLALVLAGVALGTGAVQRLRV
jgi:drug/metabolite transporter (DMT)-like permease